LDLQEVQERKKFEFVETVSLEIHDFLHLFEINEKMITELGSSIYWYSELSLKYFIFATFFLRLITKKLTGVSVSLKIFTFDLLIKDFFLKISSLFSFKPLCMAG
jgi:hypothetical protein